MKLALIVVGVAAAALTVAGSVRPEGASAQSSDCHVEQTCPSEDGSYVWYDAVGDGWICTVIDPAAPPPEDEVVIAYDGVSYACRATEPIGPLRVRVEEQAVVPLKTIEEVEASPPAAPAELTPARVAGSPSRASRRKPAPLRPAFGARRLKPPSLALPPLTAGGYVFPVYGPAAFVDTFGAPRSTVSWHHGEDIFAPLGAPVLAVADGTVFSVGWNDVGGNRLWLRDRAGNEFYYAHLSAFSTLAVNGAQVVAGAVLGFVGTTGDAQGTPPHLHFEIHPVGLLALGYDGVVRPHDYLRAWQRLEDVPFGTAALVFSARGGRLSSAPQPGAILLGASDISSATGLEPGAVRRALDEPVGTSTPTTALADERLALDGAPTVSPAARADIEAALRKQAVEFASRSFFGPLDAGVWDALATCESNGNWAADTGNGFVGGLQFEPGTWVAYGGGTYAASAARASRAEQIAVARLVLAGQGWGAWPACSAKLGLR